ncbi:MAG: carbohydrate kinase family protein [Phycisphaeraceae bacterium]
MSDTAANPDAVIVGHVCLDIIPSLAGDAQNAPAAGPMIAPGTLTRIGPATLATGGAVANTGLAMRQLGAAVRLVGSIGDDLFGEAIMQVMRHHDVPTDHLLCLAGDATSYSIVISPPGQDRSFLHCPGVNDLFEPARVSDDYLTGARLLHFGYPPMMRRVWIDGGEQLADLFKRAGALGLTTSLDLCFPDASAQAAQVDWRAFMARVLPQVDLFVPSADEIAMMLGKPQVEVGDLQAVSALAAELLALGPAAVVLKLGEAGLYAQVTADADRLAGMGDARPADVAQWRGGACHAPCFTVDVQGTTGAGDTTVAGLLTAILEGQPLLDAMTFAVGVGGHCVEQPDAVSGVPAAEVVHRRIAAGWRRRQSSAAPDDWSCDAASGNRIRSATT